MIDPRHENRKRFAPASLKIPPPLNHRCNKVARRAVMPGDEIDGRRLDSMAPLTAQAAEKIFKGHIALALGQQRTG
jgi:hypothetical protein